MTPILVDRKVGWNPNNPREPSRQRERPNPNNHREPIYKRERSNPKYIK